VQRAISLGNVDAPGRNRTCDPLLRRQVLFPLSYEGDGRKIAHLPRDRASWKAGGVGSAGAARRAGQMNFSRAPLSNPALCDRPLSP
jgi:hypothetical protein